MAGHVDWPSSTISSWDYSISDDSVVDESISICESLEDGDDDGDEEIVDVVCVLMLMSTKGSFNSDRSSHA